MKDGLAAFDEKCCRLLQKRSRLIRFFRERALQSKDERAWLIATAAVFYFTPSGSAAQSDLKKFSEKLQNLKKELAESIVLSDEQKLAINAVNKNNVCIITGGPGTGKTTIIKCLIELYKKHNKKGE